MPVAFDELLTGVSAGRWDMNVPIFVTPERAQRVAFSVPVWSLSDGFVVRRGNPKSLTSYSLVGSDGTARLGLIPGQVQFDAAQAAGVPSDQILYLDDRRAVESGSNPELIASVAATPSYWPTSQRDRGNPSSPSAFQPR